MHVAVVASCTHAWEHARNVELCIVRERARASANGLRHDAAAETSLWSQIEHSIAKPPGADSISSSESVSHVMVVRAPAQSHRRGRRRSPRQGLKRT